MNLTGHYKGELQWDIIYTDSVPLKDLPMPLSACLSVQRHVLMLDDRVSNNTPGVLGSSISAGNIPTRHSVQ